MHNPEQHVFSSFVTESKIYAHDNRPPAIGSSEFLIEIRGPTVQFFPRATPGSTRRCSDKRDKDDLGRPLRCKLAFKAAYVDKTKSRFQHRVASNSVNRRLLSDKYLSWPWFCISWDSASPIEQFVPPEVRRISDGGSHNETCFHLSQARYSVWPLHAIQIQRSCNDTRSLQVVYQNTKQCQLSDQNLANTNVCKLRRCYFLSKFNSHLEIPRRHSLV